MANANRAVIAFSDQVDEPIAVAGLDVKLWMATCHLREYGREVGRTEGQWCRDAQSAAKLPGGQDRLVRNFYLCAHPGCIVTKRRTSLR